MASLLDQYRRDLERQINQRLNAAAIVVHNHVKHLISVDGTLKTKPGRGAGGRFTKGKLIYGANPSKPGEPPRVQTGRLRGSIAWEVRPTFEARVGTNVKYGLWLQTGTKRMAARPYLDRGLREKLGDVQRILTAPLASFTGKP